MPAIVSIGTTAAIDDPSEEPAPTPTEQAEHLLAADARPITFADALHETGITVCTESRRLVTVADADHGIGVAVCV